MFSARPLRLLATAASDVDRLLDLLVKKQVVTEREAAALRAENDKEKAVPAGTSLVV